MDEQPPSSAAAAPESRAEQIDARRRTVLQQLGELDEELDALRRTRAGISDDDEHDPDGVPFSAQWSRLEGLKRNKLDADRKSTRLNSSHVAISYAVFCLKKKNKKSTI